MKNKNYLIYNNLRKFENMRIHFKGVSVWAFSSITHPRSPNKIGQVTIQNIIKC